MIRIPMVVSQWWDDSMSNSLRTSRLISKPIECDPFPGGFVLTIGDRPRSCGRKRCKRLSGCDNVAEEEQVPAKKVPADFQINVDVHQFKPEELSVKAANTYVIVEGKHEEKHMTDEYALRTFVRRFQLPDGHDNDKITSTLSSDGILTITAPKKVLSLPEPDKERSIPVAQPKERAQNEVKNEDGGSGQDFTLEDLDE